MNKTLKVMTSAALLAGVVAPVAVTTVDAANSKNLVNKVIYVDDDYKTEYKDSDGKLTTALSNADNYLTIKEDDVQFGGETDTFRLSLPSGAKWIKEAYQATTTTDSVYIEGSSGVVRKASSTADSAFEVVSVTDRDLELKIRGAWTGEKQQVDVPLFFEVDGADGEIKVTVDPRGSVITGGQYTIATVGEGSTSASIASVKTIRDGGTIDTIRIDENSKGALYDAEYKTDAQEITLTLPSDFEWDVKENKPLDYVKLGGGFDSTTIEMSSVKLTKKENKLTVEFKFKDEPKKLGTIYLENLAIDADKRAEYGEIEVDLDGDEVTSGTIVVAKYGDFGTTAELKGDVPTLLAGRLSDDKKDIETVEVLLKETVAGSWLENRSVDIEFPSWVKVIGADISDNKNIDNAKDFVENLTNDIEGDSNEISFDLPEVGDSSSSKKEFKVKFYISTKADAEGDVTVKIDGRAGIQVDETVIAKVVAPVKVETEKVDVRTGIKKQALKDIVITEAVKGALLDDKTVELKLSDGKFTNDEPTIKVEEGNIKIDQESIDITDDGYLKFEIDGESTRASKIVISGLALDLDRAIPEGEVTVEVGGTAIVQNSTFGEDFALENAFGKGEIKLGDKTYAAATADKKAHYDLSGKVDAGEFDRDYVVKKAIATVTTPADGNVSAEKVTLTIGSSTMKVGDKEVALDAAPFIEASTGRTYLPVRAIANAIGASSVEWDNATRTATVIKGGLVAQMTIGQNAYVLNGSKIGMDGKAQVVSERTFLPIRALGSALGANVEWDAATQTVTIK